jgi:hypothetical protein
LLLAHSFAMSAPTLFAFLHKEPLFLHIAQDTFPRDLLAEAPEQAIL